MEAEFVPRHSWTGEPHGNVRAMLNQAKYVFFGYTRKSYEQKLSPGAHPDEVSIIQELDYLLKGDLSRRPDIRYNFLLGTDGKIYEGRGWGGIPRLPAKYYKYNTDSYYVTFIGDFSDERPTEHMFLLRDAFLKYGVKNYFIRRRFLMITLPDHYGYHLESFSHQV